MQGKVGPGLYRERMRAAELDVWRRGIDETGGDVAQLARLYGLARTWCHVRIRALGLGEYLEAARERQAKEWEQRAKGAKRRRD